MRVFAINNLFETHSRFQTSGRCRVQCSLWTCEGVLWAHATCEGALNRCRKRMVERKLSCWDGRGHALSCIAQCEHTISRWHGWHRCGAGRECQHIRCGQLLLAIDNSQAYRSDQRRRRRNLYGTRIFPLKTKKREKTQQPLLSADCPACLPCPCPAWVRR